VSHRARLDVPAAILKAVTGWLARHRRRPGARPWQRAATVHAQVLLVLRWLRHRADLHTLAADAQVSDATAYRYLHEGLEVIAAHAPGLHEVLAAAHAAGAAYLCLDGTLVPTDRVAARAEAGHDLWYSGKHHRHGGSVQVLTDPTGFPLWVSAVRPGSVHDLTAARELVLPALYPHAARGLPVLADKGYIGAGIRRSSGHPVALSCIPTHAPTTDCSPRCGHRPNVPMRCSAAGAPCTASPSAPGESASSPQPRWCSRQCSEAAGEKTSVRRGAAASPLPSLRRWLIARATSSLSRPASPGAPNC
jgi:hypothetical protein